MGTMPKTSKDSNSTPRKPFGPPAPYLNSVPTGGRHSNTKLNSGGSSDLPNQSEEGTGKKANG